MTIRSATTNETQGVQSTESALSTIKACKKEEKVKKDKGTIIFFSTFGFFVISYTEDLSMFLPFYSLHLCYLLLTT